MVNTLQILTYNIVNISFSNSSPSQNSLIEEWPFKWSTIDALHSITTGSDVIDCKLLKGGLLVATFKVSLYHYSMEGVMKHIY